MTTRNASKHLFIALLWAGMVVLFGCDGDGDGSACADKDGDGYGDPAGPECTHAALDCDDAHGAANPGAIEGPPGDPPARTVWTTTATVKATTLTPIASRGTWPLSRPASS